MSGADTSRLIEYANVPAIIGTLVSNRIATLNELQIVYGCEDAYNLLEIVNIDGYNNAQTERD